MRTVELGCLVCHGSYTVAASQAIYRKVCSRKCLWKWNAIRYKGDRNARWIPRVRKECLTCGADMFVLPASAERKKFCSQRCQGLHTVTSGTTNTRNTDIEVALATELAARGAIFTMHQRIESYEADFLFAESSLVVEADGTYWHNLPGNAERDRVKDLTLTGAGYAVLRFDSDQIHTDVGACVDEIWDAMTPESIGTPFMFLIEPHPPCSIKGCNRVVHARGWCGPHYQRWRKYGEPTYKKPPIEMRVCTVDGCDKKHVARGFCANHLYHWNSRDKERIRTPQPVANPGEAVCAVADCDKAVSHRAWCNAHYQRWWRYGDPLLVKATA